MPPGTAFMSNRLFLIVICEGSDWKMVPVDASGTIQFLSTMKLRRRPSSLLFTARAENGSEVLLLINLLSEITTCSVKVLAGHVN